MQQRRAGVERLLYQQAMAGLPNRRDSIQLDGGNYSPLKSYDKTRAQKFLDKSHFAYSVAGYQSRLDKKLSVPKIRADGIFKQRSRQSSVDFTVKSKHSLYERSKILNLLN